MNTLIIGGGWSGLAAAVRLAEQGQQVTIIEAAKQLGGRARNVEWQNKTLDNGQHLMIGAYRSMLQMLDLIGADSKTLFIRKSLDITVYDTEYSPLRLSTHNPLPWPLCLAWSLIRSAGFSIFWQVSKLQTNIKTVLSAPDITVDEWLKRTGQSKRLIKQLWEPLCLATLNTSTSNASAHVLATVLQDSLGQSQKDADLLIPQVPLGDVFPNKAADYIKENGGQIRLQTRVKNLKFVENKVDAIITDRGESITADAIIIATSPSQYNQLLSESITTRKPKESPITTVYLQYAETIRLGSDMVGMTGTTSQWLFDRSTQHPGLFAVVISAEGPHQTMNKTQLIKQVCEEIHHLFPFIPALAEHGFVIREKRATFLCSVDEHKARPTTHTAIDNLWLAGDYVANNYPATLEGAIQNGEACAEAILQQYSVPKSM